MDYDREMETLLLIGAVGTQGQDSPLKSSALPPLAFVFMQLCRLQRAQATLGWIVISGTVGPSRLANNSD